MENPYERRLREEREKELIKRWQTDLPTDNQAIQVLESVYAESSPNDDEADFFAALEAEIGATVDLDTLRTAMYERAIDLEHSSATPESRRTEIINVPFGMFGDGSLTSELIVRSDGFAQGTVRLVPESGAKPMILRRDPQKDHWTGYDIMVGDERTKPSDKAIVELLAMNWPYSIETGLTHLDRFVQDDDTGNPLNGLVDTYRNVLAAYSPQSTSIDTYTHYTFSANEKDRPDAQPSSKTSLTISNTQYNTGDLERIIELEHTLYTKTLGDATDAITVTAHVDAHGHIALESRRRSLDVQMPPSKIEIHNPPAVIESLILNLNALVSNRIAT